MGVNGAKNKDSDVQWFSYIFFIFLKDLFYKLSLGCNTCHYLVIFLWKLIKNSYSAIKNLKKIVAVTQVLKLLNAIGPNQKYFLV